MIQEQHVVAPVSPAQMTKLAADLASSGFVVTRDSGDPVGLNFLAEASGAWVLFLYDGETLIISALRDPQRAFQSQFNPAIRESLHCNFHRQKAIGAHA